MNENNDKVKNKLDNNTQLILKHTETYINSNFTTTF